MKHITKLLLILMAPAVNAQNFDMVLSLDGANSYLELPGPIIDFSKFTLEAWAYTSGPGGGTEQQNCIYQQRTAYSGCYESAVVMHSISRPTVPLTRFALRTHNSCVIEASADFMNYDNWHHYAGVSDGQNSYLYVDGNLVDTQALAESGSYALNIANTDIGRHWHTEQTTGFFNGYIDEVRIWSSARTPTQIQSFMNATLNGTEPGLEAYRNFNDGTATDLTQNGHDGIFRGGAEIFDWDGPPPCDLWGDVNGDTYVDVMDLVAMVNYLMGSNTGPFDADCADVNGDGIVDIGDIVVLVQIILS